MQLGSSVAMAVIQACRCSSNPTPSQKTSICHSVALKRKEKKIFLKKMQIAKIVSKKERKKNLLCQIPRCYYKAAGTKTVQHWFQDK